MLNTADKGFHAKHLFSFVVLSCQLAVISISLHALPPVAS